MRTVPPWATGPLELIVHAEGHLRAGGDFDRRTALVGFDNAIEVSVSTYLALHPIQCGNRHYAKKNVEEWLANYHSKLDFLDLALAERGLEWEIERSHIVWAHQQRNEQYHGGLHGTPEKHVLDVSRLAALWLFGVLFDVDEVEQLLDDLLTANNASPSVPQRRPEFDVAIDDFYGTVDVAEQPYSVSELLFSADPDAYAAVGAELLELPGEVAESPPA